MDSVHNNGPDVSGNQILGHTVGTNNRLGDFGDADTTGIYIGSNTPMSIVVKDNHISKDVNGIFAAGPNVQVVRSGNTFWRVGHDFVSINTFGYRSPASRSLSAGADGPGRSSFWARPCSRQRPSASGCRTSRGASSPRRSGCWWLSSPRRWPSCSPARPFRSLAAHAESCRLTPGAEMLARS